MHKKILSIFLSFLMLFNIFKPVSVYATAEPVTASLETATLIGASEWASNGSVLLAEALAKYGTLGAVAMSNASIVVGSACFAYFASKGITIAVEEATRTAATIGRHLIANASEQSDEMKRFIASVIFNVSSSATYYQNKNIRYTTNLLNKLDKFLGNYISSSTIQGNAGLMAQNVITSMSLMTPAIYSAYETFTRPVYIHTDEPVIPSGIGLYEWIYNIPASAEYVLINSNGTGTLYDIAGNIVSLIGLDYLVCGTNGWQMVNSGGTAFSNCNSPSICIDWNGLTVLEGETFASAVGLTVDYPLALDKTGALDVPLTFTDDLVVTLDDAISIGTGELTLDNAGASTTVPDIDFSILEWLQKILEAILNIPKLIATAIGDMLKVLFIPSTESVQEVRDLVDEKLPIIDDLTSYSDSVHYVMAHPEDYASNFSFIVDMSKRRTFWDYGDSKTNVLDLSWYMEYKPKVDDIIVSVAWLVFMWNFYGQLSSLISGTGTGKYINSNTSKKENDK